ncbi:hypothetical protein [Pseudonocardia sp. TMWB2A]|uniref:hypothetical protein n=1 Tax=Pseudonocardia sp. TMWB2A TaxID=687430 RepID=UPI00307D395F
MSTRQDDDSRGPTTRVLVLEDSDAIRESVVDALADAGHVTEGRRRRASRSRSGSPRSGRTSSSWT